MDSTRIPLARVLELGVRITWREAVAIVLEGNAVAADRRARGLAHPRVDTLSCVVTRGGNVEFVDSAAEHDPNGMVALFKELLVDQDAPRELVKLSRAGTDSTLADDLELLASATKRQRVEIASVAIRGLAAEAELARRTIDALRGLPVESDQLPVANAAGQLVPAEAQDAELNRLRVQIGFAEPESAPSRWRAVLVGLAIGTVLVLAAAYLLYGLPRPADEPSPPRDRSSAVAQPASEPVRAAPPAVIVPAAPDSRSAAPDSPPPPVPRPPRVPATETAPPPDAPGAVSAATAPSVPDVLPAHEPAPAAEAGVEPPTRRTARVAVTPDTAIYSWTSPGVSPPVLRYPNLPNAVVTTADTIYAPHFEILVDGTGHVETVRLRARDDQSETYYRMRMMIAAAKAWRFDPATIDGHPVRYLARVVLTP